MPIVTVTHLKLCNELIIKSEGKIEAYSEKEDTRRIYQ